MKIFSGILALAFSLLINPASAGGCDSIFEIVEDDSTYDTLTAALELTGLDDALDGGGDKTLFAPKDSAFSDIDDDTLDCLLEKRNRHVLKKVLLYHVLGSEKKAKDFKDGKDYETLLGEDVEADVSSSMIKIKGDGSTAKVTKGNINACNGVVHQINAVLIPDAIKGLRCGGGGGGDDDDDSSGGGKKCRWKGNWYKHKEWYDDNWRCENGKWKKYGGGSDDDDDSSNKKCHWKGKSYNHGKWYNDYWKCENGKWKKYSGGSDDDDDSSSHYRKCKYDGHWTSSGRWYKGPTHTCKCYNGRWKDCYSNHRDLKEEENDQVQEQVQEVNVAGQE